MLFAICCSGNDILLFRWICSTDYVCCCMLFEGCNPQYAIRMIVEYDWRHGVGRVNLVWICREIWPNFIKTACREAMNFEFLFMPHNFNWKLQDASLDSLRIVWGENSRTAVLASGQISRITRFWMASFELGDSLWENHLKGGSFHNYELHMHIQRYMSNTRD